MLRILKEPTCLRCDRELPSAEEYCPDCLRRRLTFRQRVGLYGYEGAAKEGMMRFKYGGRADPPHPSPQARL